MGNVPILDPGTATAYPAEAARIAEIIQDFDPTLELRWIPPRARTVGDEKPYGIWHNKHGHPEGGYMVTFLKENELDHRVVAMLFKMQNVTLTDLEASERAAEALKLKRQMEDREEAEEFRRWAITSDKTVRHNGVRYGW